MTNSCYFPNHKSVFRQILYHSLVVWKIAPLYFFLDQTLRTFHARNQSKCKFFRLLSAQIKIDQICVSFETTNQFFFKCCVNLQCHETQLFGLVLAEILYTFNKRIQSRYKFGEIENLKFGTLMGSLRQNNIKFQLKKYRRVISHERSLKKKWLVVSNTAWRILWIFTQPLKSSKSLLQWAIFLQSVWGLS